MSSFVVNQYLFIKKIQIYKVEGKKVVSSYSLYRIAGLTRQNYTRWLKEVVLIIGVLDEEYFPAKGSVPWRLRYYFTIDFAAALCLVAKRKEALELRRYLINQRDGE